MNALKPSQFSVRSTIVKSMTVNGKLVHRHFFDWYDRNSLDQCYLRLTLIRADGHPIGNIHNVKFPKVKRLGNVTVEENGVKVDRPHYDQPTYFYVDSDEIAAGFEYYTATLTKKADPKIDTISSKREDLTIFEK